MTDPTAISSLRAGSRTTILRVRTPPGARCPPGSRSLMRGREPPKIPPPSGLARTVAPDPVIGVCWPKSGRRNRGRNDGAFGRRSLTPLAIPNAIFLLRPRKLVEWDAYGEKFGFITLPSAMLIKLMDCLTDEEARELGIWAGKNLVKEYITFWFKEVTPETLLEGFPKLLAKYGRAFAYEELEEGDRRTIILKHGSGAKWSTFYEEAIRTAFRDHLKREVKVEKSENQVVVRLRLYE